MRTGYSGKPLFQKLGIKLKDTVCLINPPKDYFELLEMNSTDLVVSKKVNDAKFIHGFYENNKAFEESFKVVMKSMRTDGNFWVSWKKGKVSDMTEDIVRKTALQNGLVDVKVCSISKTWSGLKLVVRKEKR